MSMHHWTCPSCHQALTLQDNAYRCANGHNYDKAKEGYVNLLLVNQKRSKAPGDDKAMVQARREFLSAGYYDPLVTAMADLLQTQPLPPGGSLFDAGCGEGYYLNALLLRLRQAEGTLFGHGCDIARPAIQKAARKYPHIAFAVASTFRLPVQSACQDAVIQVFAPASEVELNRILKPGGLWLKVDPGAEHLRELKALIYARQQAHEHDGSLPDGFELTQSREVTFTLTLDTQSQRLNLLQMTPYFWSSDQAQRQHIANGLTQVTAQFRLTLLRKVEELAET